MTDQTDTQIQDAEIKPFSVLDEMETLNNRINTLEAMMESANKFITIKEDTLILQEVNKLTEKFAYRNQQEIANIIARCFGGKFIIEKKEEVKEDNAITN